MLTQLSMNRQAAGSAGHRFKRSSAELDIDEESDGTTRVRRGAGFSAWGGKRSLTENVDDDDFAKKRIARNTNAAEDGHRVVRPARAAFSAWGGK